MEYLTYSGQTAKSTWGEKSEKKGKKEGGIIRDIQVLEYLRSASQILTQMGTLLTWGIFVNFVTNYI